LRLSRMLTSKRALPRALLRPTAPGRSFTTPSRLLSVPVVIVYGEADCALAFALRRDPRKKGRLTIAFTRCRMSWDDGPHSASGSRLLAGSAVALSAWFLT